MASTILSSKEWEERTRKHLDRISPWTHPQLERHIKGKKHPIFDFLFQYYRFPIGQLETWHPPMGTLIERTPETETAYLKSQYYKADNFYIVHDIDAIKPAFRKRAQFIVDVQNAMLSRQPRLNCYGLHEYAMVYKTDHPRHEQLPLRMSDEALIKFVDSMPIQCTHYDAYRFFTKAAEPINKLRPTADTRVANEQCGCLHANMDLYKWAFGLFPYGGSDIVADAFLLAVQGRVLDMRASPYDVSELGYSAIPVETVEGRKQYEQEQRELMKAAKPIRQQLIIAANNLLNAKQIEYVNVWLNYWNIKQDTGKFSQSDYLFDTHQTLQELIGNNPNELLNIILLILDEIRPLKSDRLLGVLAAGLLEDLMNENGASLIERVEQLSKSDPLFAKLLGGVWRRNIPDEIWGRITAVQGPTNW